MSAAETEYLKPMEIREAYGLALRELGQQNKKVVVLDADVSTSTKSCYFGDAFPERFFNVGVSELGMVSMAAGFSTVGLIPFANAFATFLSLRGGDAIQGQIAVDNLNVKLVASYSGYATGQDGPSHHGITDLSLLRSMPNMTVLTACDPLSVRKAVFAAAEHVGPVYLRLSRIREEPIYTGAFANTPYTIGGSTLLRQGKDVAILAVGNMVGKALAAAKALAMEGISARVIDCYSIKPLDKEVVLAAARETGAIVTAEEHTRLGGFGSSVSELLSLEHPTPMEYAAIDDEFAVSGGNRELNQLYGLSVENIINKVHNVLKRK